MTGPDVTRVLGDFASELAQLPAGAASPALVAHTDSALRIALTAAAGRPDDLLWDRLYRVASRLIAEVADPHALPGLRAFLAENRDLAEAEAAVR